MSFCDCEDWKELSKHGVTVFKQHPIYGWVAQWKELSDEVSYTQVHTYAISIKYCPMCGKKLHNPAEE